MASPTKNRLFDTEHRLTWVLLLLRACERVGLFPIELNIFHRLIYFGNCLSQVYDSQPPSDLVLKRKWGPYYPRAQFDIDQLAFMGLIDVENVAWKSEKTESWKTAEYRISKNGFEFATSLIENGDWFLESYRFLSDLCSAYASLDEEKIDAAAASDLTYTQAGYSSGSVINFGDLKRNYSARGARAFLAAAPTLAIPNRQQQLRLYMKFLEGKAA